MEPAQSALERIDDDWNTDNSEDDCEKICDKSIGLPLRISAGAELLREPVPSTSQQTFLTQELLLLRISAGEELLGENVIRDRSWDYEVEFGHHSESEDMETMEEDYL